MGLRTLIQEAFSKERVVAAICAAPVALARVGILKGKSATVYQDPEFIKELQDAGANYLDIKAVSDGNLVTGNGPASSQAFGAKLAEVLPAKVSVKP